MGGTSTDIALLQNGEAQLTGEKRVGIAKVSLPASTSTRWAPAAAPSPAWPGKILHVGPESAGADPGPACYGRGGTAATVTDANVVLGFLDPGNFLGGRIALDAARGGGRRRRGRRQLGTSAIAAAEGISTVVNTNMAEGIRIVSVRRGVDPRRFTLVAFGGAAGLHVTEVARLLEIRRVVVPDVAAVLSAWGMLATDLRYEMVRSHVSEASRMTPAGLRELLARMEAEGRARLARLLGRGRGARARSTCATASRSSRSRCTSTGSTSARRTRSTRSPRASTGATRSCTPTARRGRRSSSSTPASPWSARCPSCARSRGAAESPGADHPGAPARVAGRLDGGAGLPLDGLPPGLEVKGAGHLRVAHHDRAHPRERARDRHAARLARHRARLRASRAR